MGAESSAIADGTVAGKHGDEATEEAGWDEAIHTPSIDILHGSVFSHWGLQAGGGFPAIALGLLPLALGTGEPGREIEGPMATIIVGGLVTSTILNLLVLPTILLHFGRFDAPGRGRSIDRRSEAEV